MSLLRGFNKYELNARTEKFAPKTYQTTANVMSPVTGAANSTGRAGTASVIQGYYNRLMMEGIVSDANESNVRKLCRDMFRYDPICGSTVEMLSTIPWSQVTLSGISDPKKREPYVRSVEAMNLQTVMPELTIDYLVNGLTISSLAWDKSNRHFIGLTPQDPEQCRITEVPFYGANPLIDIQFDAGMRELLELAKTDNRARQLIGDRQAELTEALNRGVIQLDPDTTAYIPRRTFASQKTGTPYLARAIPVWIIEKALMRGTIDLSYRRQKSILQLVVGSDEWEPTAEEVQKYVDLFLDADMDPMGAIVATPPDVNVNEISSASGFWRYDEMMDSTAVFKFRALGTSEAFVTGDVNLNTMEASLSLTLERIRYMRHVISQRFFYMTMFPYIAREHGFKRSKSENLQEVIGSDQFELQDTLFGRNTTLANDTPNIVFANREVFRPGDYEMPRLTWVKQLKPESDAAYLDIMDRMEEKGIPIPIRMQAAAAGLNISEILQGYDDDIKIRAAIAKVNKRMPPLREEPEEDGGYETDASLIEVASLPRYRSNRPGLANRKYPESLNQFRDPQTGKVLSKKGASVLIERKHKVAAEALSRIAQRENREVKDQIQHAKNKIKIMPANLEDITRLGPISKRVLYKMK